MKTKIWIFPLVLMGLFLLLSSSCKKDSSSDPPIVPITEIPVLTTNPVTNISDHAATCGGSIIRQGSAEVTSRGVCWSTTAHPTILNNHSTDGSGTGNFTSTITGLEPNSLYYIRAFATNSVGTAYGNEESFATSTFTADGYYIKGSVTAFNDFDSKGRMKIAINETVQQIDDNLYELYIPIKAGAAGFSIVKVAGFSRTTFGSVSGAFGVVTNPTPDEPTLPFQRGSVTSTSTNVFTVPEDGFYHVVFDTKYNKVAIMRVVWGLIGAATPSGWSNSTDMTPSAFNLNTMTFTITNLTLNKGEWKFRYSGGWKVEIDTSDPDPANWVKVNTNFGGAPGTLVPGGYNIVNDNPGIYTVTLAYTLGSGYVATVLKTGNIPPINYATYEMGIIGNAYNKPDGTPADWDVNFGTSLPAVSGTNYTWTYTLDLFADKEFKFRQGNDWSGKSIGYGDVTWAGPNAANFSNNGGNIKVGVAGNYTILLKIAGETETYTVTATKH